MATLNIELSRNGVDKVRAGSDTVAGSVEIAELIKASALPIRLLDSTVVEHFNGVKTSPEALEVDGEPEVLIPTVRDGDLDTPRRVKVQVAVLPRDPFDAPPNWFVSGCKRLFPGTAENPEDWTEVSSPRTVLLEKDGERILSTPPSEEFCSLLEQKAVSYFESYLSGIIDHWGWVDSGDDAVLVLEPYGLSMEATKRLTSMCAQLNWTFNVLGKSGHYPSATFRIEIKPIK